MEKHNNLQEQLKELKSEIEVLKVEEKQTHMDRLHEENVQKGETKYSTLRKVRAMGAYSDPKPGKYQMVEHNFFLARDI